MIEKKGWKSIAHGAVLILLMITLFALGFILAPVYSRKPVVTPEINITYTMNCSIPFTPSRVPAIWLNITYASEEEALHLLDELTGLEPKEVSVNNYEVRIKTVKGRFRADAVNYFTFYRSSSEPQNMNHDLNRIKEIADEFKDKVVSLLPDTEMRLKRMPIVEGSTSTGSDGEKKIHTYKVSYYGYYKEVKVRQARIHLSICNDEVFEFSVHLPQAWDLGYFIPVYGPEYALDRFMSDDVDTRDYSIRMPSAEDSIRSIDDFELAYDQGHYVDRNGFQSEVFYVISGHEYNPRYNMHCEYREYVRANIEK